MASIPPAHLPADASISASQEPPAAPPSPASRQPHSGPDGHPMYRTGRRPDSHSSLNNYRVLTGASGKNSDRGENWPHALVPSALAQLSKAEPEEAHCRTALATLREMEGDGELEIPQKMQILEALHAFVANACARPGLVELVEQARQELARVEKAWVNDIGASLLAGEDVDEGDNALLVAAKTNDVAAVRVLLHAKADPDEAAKSNGATPLFMAVQKGHEEIAGLLVKAKADVNKARDDDGATPLFMAAQEGRMDVVELLLNAGAEVNKAMNNGATPLFMAARNGHQEIVKLLLNAEADVNKAMNDGATPLFMAARNGREEIVKLLLKFKADVNQVTATGATPLFMAARNGHQEIAELLLNAKADVNKALNDGTTPLFMAARNGHQKIAELLLNAKADVNKARDDDDTTPLWIAARNGREEIVKLLLKFKADVNQATATGATPLFMAAQEGHMDVVALLLNAKADVNKAMTGGATPLLIAARNGREKVAELLLNAGAAMDRAMDGGTTPLLLAAQNDHTRTVGVLLRHADKYRSEEGGLQRWKDLINAPNGDGVTPLLAAVRSNSLSAPFLLAHCGLDNLELPAAEADRIGLLTLVADTGRGKLAWELMKAMQKTGQSPGLAARTKEALDKQEWDLVAALVALTEDSLLAANCGELLAAAFDIDREPDKAAGMPGFTVRSRRALALAIGRIYLDSYMAKANGDTGAMLAMPSQDKASVRRAMHDVGALCFALSADATIDPRDRELDELKQFIDGLDFTAAQGRETIAMIGKLDSKREKDAAGNFVDGRPVLPYFQDGTVNVQEYDRSPYGVKMLLGKLDDRLTA